MIELFVAFGAGLISFLSPCVLPLIPGYISYISGSSLNELLEKKTINIFPIVLFTFGFSIVFISFGATATFLGSLILSNSFELRIIAGSIIIIFSLHIMGLINIKFLNYEKRINTEIKSGNFSSILVGMAFGFGWTPCIGPILGSIPFIASGYLIQRFMVVTKNLKSKMITISRIGGGLLLITGILMITNQLQALGFYILKYFPILQKLG